MASDASPGSRSGGGDSQFAVPILSLADCEGARKAEVAAAWDEAFRTYGFAVVTDHGVSPAATEALISSAMGFFTLSAEDKDRSNLHAGYGPGGFVPVGVEAVARSRGDASAVPDPVENLVFKHGAQRDSCDVVPENPPELQGAVAQYWAEMHRLLLRIMDLSATALGLSPSADAASDDSVHDADVFRKAYARPSCSLRLAHYPPQVVDATQEKKPPVMRYGEHTDYTGFTILRQDPSQPGLEVRMPDGSWAGVSSPPGGLVINAGDLIQRWTNDRWLSNLHRVAAPDPAHSTKSRLSLVFFTGPSDDTVCVPLSTCCSAENPAKYEPITAGEHLAEKLRRSNASSQ